MRFPFRRFSLRTLLLAVLLIGSAGGLYYRWQPWAKAASVDGFASQFSADLRYSATFNQDLSDTKTISVRDTFNNAKTSPDVTLPNIWAVKLSPDGQMIVALERSGKCLIMKTSDLARQREIQVKPFLSRSPMNVQFSPNSRYLFVDNNNFVRSRLDLLDLTTGKPVFESDDAAYGFSPDSSLLTISSDEGIVILKSNGEKRQSVSVNYGIRAFAYSPDSNRLIMAGSDSKVHIWDIRAQREVDAFDAPVSQASNPFFTADGRFFITRMNEKYDVWDVSQRKPIATYNHYIRLLHSSADGEPRLLVRDSRHAMISRATDHLKLGDFPVEPMGVSPFAMPEGYNPPPNTVDTSSDGTRVMLYAAFGTAIFERIRPEIFLGLRFPPELWLAVLLFFGLAWSVSRDVRGFDVAGK